MLVFLYMAGRMFSVLEKDILNAAQNDHIGYLSFYKTINLKKSESLLRPINIPSHNKWIRVVSHSLH